MTEPWSWCETHTFSGHSRCRSLWIMGNAHGSHEEPLWVGFQAPQISHPPTCAYLNQISLSCFVSIQLFFFFPQVQTCGFLTGISQKNPKKTHTKRIQTKRQDSPSPSQTQTITNMTYQSPVQWSRTKDPLFMEHFLFGAFSGL